MTLKMKRYSYDIVIWLGLVLLRILTEDASTEIMNLIISTSMFYFSYAVIFYSTTYVYDKKIKKIGFIVKPFMFFFVFIIGIAMIRISAGVSEFFFSIKTPFDNEGLGIYRSILFMLFGLVYQVIRTKNQLRFKSNQLEIEKKYAELQFLKYQINPHFFFNTLNNIYGLAYKKDDMAPKLILKLSETMRYVIYETAKDFVDVNAEINFLRNYVELEKLRLTNPQSVKFECDFNYINSKIAPLILLNLVENCFKHGNLSDNDAYLEIRIWKENECLNFSSENSFTKNNKLKVGGVGSENLMKRLKLIYNNNYTYDVNVEDNVYFAFLSIPLN
jgi:sensor histidine kinase YesM